MESYTDRLAHLYHDAPPDDEGFGRFGIWYEDVDPITAAYLKDLKINTVEDELSFYRYFSQTPSRGFLCAIVNGKMIQPFTDELEESVSEIIARTPDQEFRDAQTYFQYHGLSQDQLFKFIQPRIDAWILENPDEFDDCTCVYDPANPHFYYDLGWIPDYDGVQLDAHGKEIERPCRMRAGADETVMEYRPQSPTYDPEQGCSEVYKAGEPSQVVDDIFEELNHLHPVLGQQSGVDEFVQQVQLDLNFQKLQAGYSIDTDAYNYVALSMKPYLKFQNRLPRSSLEYYVFGSILATKEHLDEPVPEAICSAYPEIQGMQFYQS